MSDNNPLITLNNFHNTVSQEDFEEKIEEALTELFETHGVIVELVDVNEGDFSTDIILNVCRDH